MKSRLRILSFYGFDISKGYLYRNYLVRACASESTQLLNMLLRFMPDISICNECFQFQALKKIREGSCFWLYLFVLLKHSRCYL